MLVAFLIYNDGIGTIIRMATIYGTEIGIGQRAMIGAILLVQFVGIPFAFLFGTLAGRIGAKRSIFLGLVVYTGISVLAYFMTNATHFFLLAILVGMVQGGTQALSRSLFASLIPPHKSGEFFGFFASSRSSPASSGRSSSPGHRRHWVQPNRDPVGDRLLRGRRGACSGWSTWRRDSKPPGSQTRRLVPHSGGRNQSEGRLASALASPDCVAKHLHRRGLGPAMGAGDYGCPAFATAEDSPAYRRRVATIRVAAATRQKWRRDRISELVEPAWAVSCNCLPLADGCQARDHGHGRRPRRSRGRATRCCRHTRRRRRQPRRPGRAKVDGAHRNLQSRIAIAAPIGVAGSTKEVTHRA